MEAQLTPRLSCPKPQIELFSITSHADHSDAVHLETLQKLTAVGHISLSVNSEDLGQISELVSVEEIKTQSY